MPRWGSVIDCSEVYMENKSRSCTTISTTIHIKFIASIVPGGSMSLFQVHLRGGLEKKIISLIIQEQITTF